MFHLDRTEMESLHKLTFEAYESGKLTLDEYLDLVIFHQKRSFSRSAFRRFMFAQSQPFPRMIQLVAGLKLAHGLKVLVVNNEARELNAHRIRTFQLSRVIDVFVSSCCVHLRKPDPDIFRLALDLAQVAPERVAYIENTPMFVAIARQLGIRGVVHVDEDSTRAALSSLGLSDAVQKE